jgi:multiphosphoryl transfer protein
MLAGADPAVLAASAGHDAILDAAEGELIVDPDPPTEVGRIAPGQQAGRIAPGRQAAARAPREVRTADGEPVTLLCNVASVAETRLGLSGGAAGVGLLRTEIPYTSTPGWPSEADHLAQLSPVLALLEGRPAVVRLLDFSGDAAADPLVLPLLLGLGVRTLSVGAARVPRVAGWIAAADTAAAARDAAEILAAGEKVIR